MREKLGYIARPQSVTTRVGIKVMWLYFKTKPEAEAASKVAVHNAKIAANQGYDFGYQSPGAIRKMAQYEGEWAEYSGLYEVCFS